MSGVLTLVVLIAGFYFCTAASGENITVSTSVGEFIGLKKNFSLDGNMVQLSTFLGIPYAEPPVGDLRFRKPVPKAPLTSPLVTHKHGSECIQVLLFGYHRPSSEDCLFLNIYVPEKLSDQEDLAVMIFIHGGAYVVGSSNFAVADELATRGNVIVVTINYRLSALGFLNAEDNGDSNFGLWDQHMAIKWVHDNIQAFGGDNQRITIFGESAGAGSVIYQGLYPGNQGLFQRIIAESGTAQASWGVARHPKADSRRFAAVVGCNFASTSKMMACLRNTSTALINETLNDFSNGLYQVEMMPFVPSLDKEFSPISPKITLNKDKVDYRTNAPRSVFAQFDLMMGVNSGEGAASLVPEMGVEGNPENFLPNRSYFEDTLVPICAKFEYGSDIPDAVIEALINVYTPWNDPENPSELREKFLDMNGDIQFLAPTIQTIELYSHVSTKDPYMYYFTAQPSYSNTPTWVNRPDHGEELFYVFGEVNVLLEWGYYFANTDWEKQLTKRMMTMWSNFAKTGNPNLPHNIETEWLPYNTSHHNYLDIGRFVNQTETKERLFEDRVHMWNEVLPKIVSDTAAKICETDTSGSESYVHKISVSVLIGTLFMFVLSFP